MLYLCQNSKKYSQYPLGHAEFQSYIPFHHKYIDRVDFRIYVFHFLYQNSPSNLFDKPSINLQHSHIKIQNTFLTHHFSFKQNPSSSSQPSRCFPPCEYLCESYHQPPSPHLLSSTIHFHLPSDNTPHLPLLICSYFIFLAIFSSLPFADLHLPPFFACNMSASYHPLKIIKKSAINLPFDRFRLKPSKIYEEELSYYLMLPGKYGLNRLFLLPLSCPQIHPHADPLTTTLPPCYKLSSPFEKQNHQQL